MSTFQIGLDNNGNPTYGVAFSNKGYSATLSAGDAATLAIPSGYNLALITNTPGSTLLVGPNEITAEPGTSFSERFDEVNPALRDVKGLVNLYFYAIDNCTVHVSFYK